MPNDTINNAIKKASGATIHRIMKKLQYEGYGTKWGCSYSKASKQ